MFIEVQQFLFLFNIIGTTTTEKPWLTAICQPESLSDFHSPPQQVSVGPFTVIKSIDTVTENLADKLSAEKSGVIISTKNIGNEHVLKNNLKSLKSSIF